jgi:pimeloyl-ACP methyl ester carboxylesterase
VAAIGQAYRAPFTVARSAIGPACGCRLVAVGDGSHHLAVDQPICFLAGESAVRSWRYVVPHLPLDTVTIYHELVGNTATDPDYEWRDEVEALGLALPTAVPAHLVGFSGGATLALAFVADHPDRVASMALVEPAWSFLPPSDVEADYYERLGEALRGPASAERGAFRRLLVRDDVELEPPRQDLVDAAVRREAAGRRTALRTMTEAMQQHVVAPASFARFHGRVYIAMGGRSNVMWRAQGDALAAAFPVSRLEIFEARHHLDPPQKSETSRLVGGLRWAWSVTSD